MADIVVCVQTIQQVKFGCELEKTVFLDYSKEAEGTKID